MLARDGGLLVSSTNTVKVCVALRLGVPLSVTMTLMIGRPGRRDWVGVQLNTPLVAPRVALRGAYTRLKVSVFAGRSGSEAELVKVRSVPSVTVLSAMVVSDGGLLDSSTNTVKLCVALRLGVPLSVTMTL